MITGDLLIAVAEATQAIRAARDPDAALRRLLRFVSRERAFAVSPASLTDQQLAAARGAGVPLQMFAGSIRRNPERDT